MTSSPGPMPSAVRRDVQRGGAVGDADGELAALPLGESLLELHAALAGPVVDLAGAQRLLDGADGLLVEPGPVGELVLDGGRAAVEGEGS